MGTSSKLLAQKLRQLALGQHGCFTAAQAIGVGYADSVHLYHVKTGNWIRIFRGVYRLATVPETPASRCMAALFWSRNKKGVIQGILAPRTVKNLQDGTLPDDQPIGLLVSNQFRRSSGVPAGIEIIKANLSEHTTSIFEGMPVAVSPKEAKKPIPPEYRQDICEYYDQMDYEAGLWRAKP